MRRHCEDQGAHYCEALARIPNMDSWLPLGMPLSIAAAGLASAAHASAWPTSQRWGPSYHRLRTDASDIALTFDDGPSNETMRFLDVLDGLGVPATFFVCGRNVERQPKTARAIVEAGHALGNHTFSHPCLPFYRFDLVQRQIARTQDAIGAATGCRVTIFRPPYGLRATALRHVLPDLGLIGVHWSVMGMDWKWSADRIAARIEDRADPGAIVCLHDGQETRAHTDRTQTIQAVRRIVPKLRDRGYRFVRLPDWQAQQ